ncbi:MAG: 30S ribosomal protein S16 [Patescibacteria group bacterium]|nr:30S ribosomal protein S16 [Patescibacteria group bacterium]
MLKIKLFQRGKKHQRSYRIVVAPARSKRDGKYTDYLGFLNPKTNTLSVDREKIKLWLSRGAQLTEGVRKALNPTKN